MKELQTIVDHIVNSPSIDVVAFPGTPMTHDHPEIPISQNAERSPFWTSSAFLGTPYQGEAPGPRAFIVDFVNGFSWTELRTAKWNVRCVR